MSDTQLLIAMLIFIVLLYVFGLGSIHYYFKVKGEFIDRLQSKLRKGSSDEG